MNDTTLSKIKAHLKESEGAIPHPYLDSNGFVTAGVGFNINKKEEFTALDFWTRDRDGTVRRASPTEKATAYDQMITAREANNGDHNRPENAYIDTTKVFLPDEVMEKTFDDKAREHMTGAQREVGKDAFDKLNDSQKAAVTDIRYANGSLKGFPKLKDAIKEGDARKMADESTFFADSKTGRRAEGRLKRNFQALSGLSREESDERLQEVLKKNDAARKNKPSNRPASHSGSEDKPSGGEGPSQSENVTSGTDAGDDDVSRERTPEQNNLPNAPIEMNGTLETLVADPDTGAETKELTPAQQNLLDDFDKTDGPLDDIIAKDPKDLTEAEFVELKKELIKLPAGPEQEQLDAIAVKFLEDKFGTGPAKVDAVGRMIDPKAIRPINKTPVPAKTPDGESLQNAISKIGNVVAETAGDEGSANAVQGLQRGLNLLKQVALRGGGNGRARTPAIVPDLKTDGVVGPKTRRALKIATSSLGTPRIKEGLALGRFGKFTEDIQAGRDDTRKLALTIAKSFGTLFRNPRSPVTGRGPSPNRPAEENLAFQSTINDLGSQFFGHDTFKPIREDGLIGPRTETAFNTVLPATGPDRFTSRFGHNLGFFDFDDIA